jgi:hypothetical protein
VSSTWLLSFCGSTNFVQALLGEFLTASVSMPFLLFMVAGKPIPLSLSLFV